MHLIPLLQFSAGLTRNLLGYTRLDWVNLTSAVSIQLAVQGCELDVINAYNPIVNNYSFPESIAKLMLPATVQFVKDETTLKAIKYVSVPHAQERKYQG